MQRYPIYVYIYILDTFTDLYINMDCFFLSIGFAIWITHIQSISLAVLHAKARSLHGWKLFPWLENGPNDLFEGTHGPPMQPIRQITLASLTCTPIHLYTHIHKDGSQLCFDLVLDLFGMGLIQLGYCMTKKAWIILTRFQVGSSTNSWNPIGINIPGADPLRSPKIP